MFKVREWERFQFAIDYQHHQVRSSLESVNDAIILVNLIAFSAQENSGEDNPRCYQAFNCTEDRKQLVFKSKKRLMQYFLF
jgi:hypothetical protein